MGILSSQYYSYHRIEALSCVKIVSQSSEIDVVTTSSQVPLYIFLKPRHTDEFSPYQINKCRKTTKFFKASVCENFCANFYNFQ